MELPEGLPFLDPEGLFPGGWVEDARGLRTWQGETAWLTRHGDAVVHWLLGKPHSVYGAVLPGGERIDLCETWSPARTDYWRRPYPSGKGYVTGLLKISDDGVVFTDAPLPDRDLEMYDGLAEAMADHPRARELFLDDRFAGAANDYFRNAGFRRDGADDPAWSISFRGIGRVIAEIRGIGESYVDFYLGEHEYDEADEARVVAFLEELGWHRMTPEEEAADHAAALALLAEVEARVEGSVPEADRPEPVKFLKEPGDGARPSMRLHRAANEGKVTRAEKDAFFARVDITRDR